MNLEERRRQASVKAVEMLEENYIRLGRPSFDIKSKAFWEFFEILVDLWHVAYPLEVVEWLETREFDLATEKTLQQQVDSGFHKKYAFPAGLFRMIKTYWPNGNLLENAFAKKFMSKFPIFRNSNFT